MLVLPASPAITWLPTRACRSRSTWRREGSHFCPILRLRSHSPGGRWTSTTSWNRRRADVCAAKHRSSCTGAAKCAGTMPTSTSRSMRLDKAVAQTTHRKPGQPVLARRLRKIPASLKSARSVQPGPLLVHDTSLYATPPSPSCLRGLPPATTTSRVPRDSVSNHPETVSNHPKTSL